MADILRSERMTYRAIEESDDPFLLELHSDMETHLNTTPWLPTPQSRNSAAEHRQHFTSCMLSAIPCIPRAADDKDRSLRPIGIVSLKDANQGPNGRHFRHAKLSVTLAKDYRGQGYGAEAIKWLLQWGFHRAALHKISLSVYEYNTPAIKLYEKLGFVLEGTLRDEVWHDGRWWADHVYSMLEDEWRERYTPK